MRWCWADGWPCNHGGYSWWYWRLAGAVDEVARLVKNYILRVIISELFLTMVHTSTVPLESFWMTFKLWQFSVLEHSYHLFLRILIKYAASGVRSMRGFTEGNLPLQVLFYRRLSSTKGPPPTKVVFHWRSSSTKGCLPRKFIFHPSSSSTQGHVPPRVVHHLP